MIIAHLSDLHLGYRAFGNIEQGRNIREADVARAFHQAIQRVLEIGPAAVLVAGDVFDRPEPPHSALVALAQGLQSLREALPETPVLMAAGARDTPAGPADPGPLAAFDTLPGVEAVTATTRSVHYSLLNLNVVLVPHRSTIQGPRPLVEPNPDARWNVLVGYGSVDREESALLSLDSGDWDYVALGHEHFRREVVPRVHYAGALERVGATPWEEAAEEKGFLTCDLESGQVRLQPVHGRPVVSLEPIPFEADRPRTAEGAGPGGARRGARGYRREDRSDSNSGAAARAVGPPRRRFARVSAACTTPRSAARRRTTRASLSGHQAVQAVGFQTARPPNGRG